MRVCARARVCMYEREIPSTASATKQDSTQKTVMCDDFRFCHCHHWLSWPRPVYTPASCLSFRIQLSHPPPLGILPHRPPPQSGYHTLQCVVRALLHLYILSLEFVCLSPLSDAKLSEQGLCLILPGSSAPAFGNCSSNE